MNRVNLKTILYIVIGIFIIRLFFSVLPYLIVAGVVAYGVLKIVGYFKGKRSNGKFENTSTYSPNSDSKVYKEDDIDTSKAIDVDFKDI